MSEEAPKLAAQPIQETEESKELTDKIHRLVRYFSRQLVNLVSEEIGARAIKLKGKPGPRKGYKMPLAVCPICQGNPNSRRRFGFICKDCSAGREIGYRDKMKKHFPMHRPVKQKKKDKLGCDWRVKVKVPKHLPVKPKDVPMESIPDAEPAFLDSLLAVIDTTPPPEPIPAKRSDAPSSDDGEMDWFS